MGRLFPIATSACRRGMPRSRYKLRSPGPQLWYLDGLCLQTVPALPDQLSPRHCDNDEAEIFDLHIQNQA